ncbi:protein of unknown function [Azospirillum baldaniorum]|uniref:Uncharacterized protein n=1 Tax=Azospirillum baldaniorum TaxID=1064539 RepID=A0A9P1JSP4_9PROT|nr:protein of unknown function [Azospirillum baldaniorum]
MRSVRDLPPVSAEGGAGQRL